MVEACFIVCVYAPVYRMKMAGGGLAVGRRKGSFPPTIVSVYSECMCVHPIFPVCIVLIASCCVVIVAL